MRAVIKASREKYHVQCGTLRQRDWHIFPTFTLIDQCKYWQVDSSLSVWNIGFFFTWRVVNDNLPAWDLVECNFKLTPSPLLRTCSSLVMVNTILTQVLVLVFSLWVSAWASSGCSSSLPPGDQTTPSVPARWGWLFTAEKGSSNNSNGFLTERRFRIMQTNMVKDWHTSQWSVCLD